MKFSNKTIKQRGYFLLIAVILIMVVAVMGAIMAYTFSDRAMLAFYQRQALQTFYNAESGLEIITRLLTNPTLSGTPSRITCGAVTGNSTTTAAALNGGQFTVTSIHSSPVFAKTTLSSSTTASSTVLNLTSISGFAPSGRVMIDREAIDYSAISGSTLLGITRGVSGTLASVHASGAAVGQYQCSVSSQAGTPTISTPNYQREISAGIALQDGWAVGALNGSNYTLTNWNHGAENDWINNSFAGGAANEGNLNSVSMLSYGDGWAVGNIATNGFLFLRWNGSSWVTDLLAGACSGQHLLSVSMVSSTQGFAVGVAYKPNCRGGSALRYTILQWDGSAWSLLTPNTSPSVPADDKKNQTLNAVHAIDTTGNGTANIGFAVGNNGRILQYNGTNWVEVTSPTTRNLTSVKVISNYEAWAVGASGTIIKWDGSTWNTVTSPTTVQLNEIDMIDTTGNGIADFGIGVGNSGRIVTYNGSTWSTTKYGSNNLFGVSIIHSNINQEAWAVGASGTALHWDGTSWISVSSGVTTQLNSVKLIGEFSPPVSAWQQVFN